MRRDEHGPNPLDRKGDLGGLASENCAAVCQSDARRAKIGVFAVDVKTATDVGQVRQNNEDALWVTSRCLVVCDGMGGHLAGEVASEVAVNAIQSFPFTGVNPEEEVLAAIRQAQESILDASAKNQEYHGMGSTITLAWVSDPDREGNCTLTVGHVGDSRCYIFSDGALEQMTRDHSVVGELLRSGTITAAEARNHPKKHMLTQALGAEEIEIDLITKDLLPGTLVMLCTDGLTDLVDDALIEERLKQGFDSGNLAQELVDLANASGGVDNVTVIVAKV
ncbi:MAG TPA: Stp1/IreP family PP2C-type Ser/Thr phosphatase [Firmicutes bacterium]|jgi:protein phosphatase|nr:Stp1/IreP family PP2C-type Ser/Thr phosphatase [Bacillota bacterium]